MMHETMNLKIFLDFAHRLIFDEAQLSKAVSPSILLARHNSSILASGQRNLSDRHAPRH
jgi:hypothetical protein